MNDEHPLEDLRHPRSTFSTWVGVVLLLAVFGLFVWVVIGASPRGDTYEAKRAKVREEKLKTAREEAEKALTTYGWIDKNKGVARIPIDQAMQLTLADLAAKKPMPANPIATPEPAQSVAAPATPAPASSAAASTKSQPEASATPKPVSVEGPNSMIHGEPTGTYNPTGAAPGTQPGPSTVPASSPAVPSVRAPQSPSATPVLVPPGTPLPVRGTTPTPTPAP